MRAMLLIATLLVAAPVYAQTIPPCHCGCMETGQCKCKNCCERTADPTWKAHDDYGTALALSKSSGKPFIVGVCCNPPRGAWVGCRVATFVFPGPMPRLVVSNARGEWLCDLPAHATPDEIEQALTRPVPLFTRSTPTPGVQVAPRQVMMPGRGSACSS